MKRAVFTAGAIAAAAAATTCWVAADESALRTRIRNLVVRSVAVLDKTTADYFVCFGTLLGAVRDGDVILGDTDGDICVVGEASAAKISAAAVDLLREANARLEWPVRVAGRDHPQLMRIRDASKPQAYIDLYILDNDPVQRMLGERRWGHIDRGVLIPREYALPTAPLVMDRPNQFGIPLRGPANPEAVLTHVYGNDWRTPRRGDKGLEHKGRLADAWKHISPVLSDVRLGFYQLIHGK